MDLGTTRETLHRLAAHVLGHGRYQVTGRFGLRATPGGFGTPAFGEGPDVLRVSSGTLVREATDGASYSVIGGASLRDLAEFSGVTLDENFSVGPNTPSLGDVDQPLVVDVNAARLLAEWLDMAQRLVDHVAAALPEDAAPAVVQLWPEHFDLATHAALPGGGQVNLGASLGDAFSNDPYLYVGPWSDARPGDAAYWNAPFGAVLRRSDLVAARLLDDEGRFDAALGFFEAGLGMLGWSSW